ncbi:MAG: hypothetical protein J6B24_07840 [Clostridia bacterium]|nr:hypothetical protein [Clostridia bacterium]
MPETIPVEILTLRRLTRAGACVVLEVTVTYPHIREGESPAVARFNAAYLDMAERFLAWSDTAPAEEARAAYTALGSAAPYRFDRRVLTCDMTAALPSPDCLTVTRTATLKSRRGELAERTVTATDSWRLPELTAVRSPKNRRKSHGKRLG